MDIRTSDAVQEIAAALAKAQGEFGGIERSGKNPAFKRDGQPSPYATLSDVLDEIRPKLSKHGIAIWQSPVNGTDDMVGIVTRLLHSSGQWLEGSLLVKPATFTAQGVGSVMTFLRRYTLMAMAGVAPDDDDGNAASLQQPSRRATAGTNGAAVPAAPPHDPASGEIRGDLAPHKITLRETGGRDWNRFTRILIAGVKAATTQDHLADWEALNAGALITAATEAPNQHKAMKRELAAAAARLGPECDPSSDAQEGEEFASEADLQGAPVS